MKYNTSSYEAIVDRTLLCVYEYCVEVTTENQDAGNKDGVLKIPMTIVPTLRPELQSPPTDAAASRSLTCYTPSTKTLPGRTS
jgi:hypothetical protein